MEEDKPVRRVGDYEFLDRLAIGGMGELWRVRHVTLGAIYVAKQLRPEYREDPEFLKRFLHEARLVANLKHPNIVQVFGYDEEHTLYLMEYVKGVDLDHLLRSKRILTFPEKRIIIEAVADTIGYAHREVDLIHRDIKPSNVLIEIASINDPIRHSSIKLTDFGIARLMSLNQRVTMATGMVMGTLHYMAPEQFEGHADKPSDVYSIGVLYYQLLTATLPFDGATAFVIRDKHVSETPPTPHDLNPAVPLEDSAIVMKCLEKDPARRFQDSAELYEAFVGSQGIPRTVALTQGVPGPPIASTQQNEATQFIEPPDQAMPQAGATQRTLLTPGARKRDTTLPPAPGAPPPGTLATAPARPTEHTIPAALARPTEETLRMEARPSRRRRVLRTTLVVLAILIGLPLLATQVLRPKYQIAWSTLRSDPLDTPNGIHVAVCPRPAFGLSWWTAGTIDEQAPPNWANWTTWFDRIDVKFSDGLYREFVLTCTKAECQQREGRLVVDFAGATFERLAEDRKVEIKEDPSGVGRYIDAVLVPKRIATTHSLPDVRRCLDRVGSLLAKAKDVQFDPTQLDAYRTAVSRLLAAASALADGNCDEAETRLRDAQAAIEKIDRGGLTELPKDFLFRQTIAGAIPILKARAGKADRLVSGLEPVADSPTSISYTLTKYKSANSAVAHYVLASPGHTATKGLLDKAGRDVAEFESLIDDMGGGVPAPIRTARRYFVRLDQLVGQTPSRDLEATFCVAVLTMLDAASGAPPAVERPAWLDKCFAAEELASPKLVRDLWQKAHQRRFGTALLRAHQLADARIQQAAAASAKGQSRDVHGMFVDAEACLEAIRKTVHATQEQKHTATTRLSATCVRHAICLFDVGPPHPDKEAAHLTAVRKLLDRGLDELPGCPPDVADQARVLRQILRVAGEARTALAACRRSNFGTRDSYRGDVRLLFQALEAYERLAAEIKKHADHPCAPATLRPFTSLRTASCEGYTLWNAAARWLLANAATSCEEGKYREATGLLHRFQYLPGEAGAQTKSPLKRLLAPQLISGAEGLSKIAACFDDSTVPAKGLPADPRWKKLWDARLQAKPLLALDIPQTVPRGSLPEQYAGHESQWAAIYAHMRTLHAHYRDRIQAEEDLRGLEAQAAGLLVRDGDTVKADPAAATPQAISTCARALAALREGGRYTDRDGHAARLAHLEHDLGAITATLTGQSERIAELLAKPDPKAALDAILVSGAALGKAVELDLTRRAVTAWAKAVAAQVDTGKLDAAVRSLEAIQKHEQTRRHATDAAIKQALDQADAAIKQARDGAAKATLYAEGLRALARGPEGFAAALAKFRQVGTYRDAETIAGQIGPVQEASKLKDKAPFQAWSRLSDLLKSNKLAPKIRAAAGGAAQDIKQTLIAGASGCTKAYNAALVKGGWEPYLGRAGIPDEQFARIGTFLGQVEGLDIEQADAPGQGELLHASGEVRIKRKRVLTFRYKLPGDTMLPARVEQTLEWTVRYVPEPKAGGRRWIVEGWEEAY